MKKQVVGAWMMALALLGAAAPGHAALVQFRMTGWVTQSGTFDDGSTVPEGTPFTVNFTYDTKQPATTLEARENGAGSASYDIAAPYHFRLRVGEHRARAAGFRVHIENDLNQPFGDTFDVDATDGIYLDGQWLAGAKLGISLLSQPGNLGALHSLALPKHLKEWSFDAFRVGRVVGPGDHTLLMLMINSIKSTVCAKAIPGTDDCAE